MPSARKFYIRPVNKFTCDCSLSFVFLVYFLSFRSLNRIFVCENQLYHVECVSRFKQGVKESKFVDYDEKDYHYFMGCDDYVAGLLSREGPDKGRHNGFL